MADNLLRLVSLTQPVNHADQLAAGLRDRIEAARLGRAVAPEFSAEFAPRKRLLGDFTGAAAAILDPERLALAYAFAPDDWRVDAVEVQPWPLRTANWYLLYAAHGGQGDVTEGELLAQALASWDQPQLVREQLQLANERAFALTGFGTCSSRLRAAAGRELASVIDRYIASMGKSLKLGDLLFLNQLRSLVWIAWPMPARFEHAIPQLEEITGFLKRSQAALEQPNFTDAGLEEEGARQDLVSAAAQCRLACQTLVERDLPQPGPDVLQEINTRFAMLGLIFALRNRAWQQSEQLVQGLTLDRLRPEPDATLHQSLGFGIRAIPLISGHFRESNPQILSTLEGLREVFPLVGPLIQEFVQAVRASIPARSVEITPESALSEHRALALLVEEAVTETRIVAPNTPDGILEAPVTDLEETTLLLLQPPVKAPVRQTPRIEQPQGQRAQPSIQVAALAWEGSAKPETPVETLSAVVKESQAGAEVPPAEPLRPKAPGSLMKPRRTNAFKVVATPEDAPLVEPRLTPLPEFPAVAVVATAAAAKPMVEPTPDAEQAPESIVIAADLEQSSPKRRILARLAGLDDVPSAPITPKLPALEKDVAAGDTLRGRPIPIPPPDVMVLPGTPLHQTPRLHGYTSKQYRREKNLDLLPGQKAPASPAKDEAPKDSTPVAEARAGKSTGPKPKAGERVRGKRQAVLAASKAGSPRRTHSLLGRRGSERRRVLMNVALLMLLLGFLGTAAIAVLHGPSVAKNFLKSSRKIVPAKPEDIHYPSESLAAESRENAAQAAAAGLGSNDVDPREPVGAITPQPEKPAQPASRRVARDVLGPTEPLKNFLQGQNSPFAQPTEVQVLSGDLGATGQPLAQPAPASLSTTEMLRRTSNSGEAWNLTETRDATAAEEAELAPVNAVAVAEEEKREEAPKPSVPESQRAALSLFDEESTVETEALAEAKPKPAPVATVAARKGSGKQPKLAVKEIIYYSLGGQNDVKAAMINDWVYQEGEELVDFSTGSTRRYKVMSIQPSEVVLKGEAGELRLAYSKSARL